MASNPSRDLKLYIPGAVATPSPPEGPGVVGGEERAGRQEVASSSFAKANGGENLHLQLPSPPPTPPSTFLSAEFSYQVVPRRFCSEMAFIKMLGSSEESLVMELTSTLKVSRGCQVEQRKIQPASSM